MASRLDSPFDLERCGPAVDLALDKVNEKFLAHHGIELQKVQGRYEAWVWKYDINSFKGLNLHIRNLRHCM